MVNRDHTIIVGEAFVTLTDRSWGSIERLYEHQVRTITSKKKVMIVDAPTGSGKTLAALARAIEHNTPAIFIYPTNALVKDQVESICSLLEKKRCRVTLIDSSWEPSDEQSSDDDSSVYVIHLTGDTLESMAENSSKGGAIERILKGTYGKGGLRIVLTNPDTLFLVSSGRYAHSGRISEQIDTFKTLVVDEFHHYSGPALARLIFMLNDLRISPDNPEFEIVFLSATHGDTLELLQSTYNDLDIIQAPVYTEGGPDRRQVRYLSHFDMHTQSSILQFSDDVDTISHELIKWYDASYEWHSNTTPSVKVLGIFSSVTFAVNVAQKVKELLNARGDNPDEIVFQHHGLIPKRERPDIKNLREAILIGTSSIEVGVDFDVPFLVVEAHDFASFLQRFGRGGRHAPCEGSLYVPLSMISRLKNIKTISFPSFITEAQQAFNELPSYARFVCSSQANVILLAMALAGSSTVSYFANHRVVYDLQKAAEYYCHLVSANKTVSVGKHQLVDNVCSLTAKDIEAKLKKFYVKVVAKHSLVRGTMNSVLVQIPLKYITGETGDVFTEMDIFDIFRLRGHLENAEQHWEQIPLSIRSRHLPDEYLFVVRDITRQTYPLVAIANNAPCKWKAAVFTGTDITIKIRKQRLRETIEQLLEKRNLVFYWWRLNRNVDYRLPRLYCEDNSGGIVIGDWALVAEFLECEKSKKQDVVVK